MSLNISGGAGNDTQTVNVNIAGAVPPDDIHPALSTPIQPVLSLSLLGGEGNDQQTVNYSGDGSASLAVTSDGGEGDDQFGLVAQYASHQPQRLSTTELALSIVGGDGNDSANVDVGRSGAARSADNGEEADPPPRKFFATVDMGAGADQLGFSASGIALAQFELTGDTGVGDDIATHNLIGVDVLGGAAINLRGKQGSDTIQANLVDVLLSGNLRFLLDGAQSQDAVGASRNFAAAAEDRWTEK